MGMMALVFLVGFAALYVAASSYARIAADRSYDQLLLGSALSIAETLSVTPGGIRVDIPYAALDMLAAAPDDRVFYRVVGPDGDTITGNSNLPTDLQVWKAVAAKGADSVRLFDANFGGERFRFVMLGREIAQPGRQGWVWVEVGQTRIARNALARALLIRALVPIGVMTIIALACIWFGVSSVLRPLQRIGAELATREPSELRELDTPVASEIQPLVDAINDFARRLAANIVLLRSFIADAAHQMRTPLAALLSQTQSIQHEDPAMVRRSLETIERSALKLTRLLNQLLSDATVSHRVDVRRFEPFDLVQTVQHAIRDSLLLSEDSDLRFTTRLDEAPLVGDEVVLGEAIKNLIHNAMVHGQSEGGEICIDLESRNDSYTLRVSDRGPGIPAKRMSTVFERFARSSSQAAGAGLGLAIVKQAVSNHGGTIELRARTGGGLIAEIRLPHR